MGDRDNLLAELIAERFQPPRTQLTVEDDLFLHEQRRRELRDALARAGPAGADRRAGG